MDPKVYWEQHKKAIVTTVVCTVVALLVIKFFDVLFLGAVVVVLAVAGVVAWNHLTDKYGGADGLWKALWKDGP